jgi:hypothetical protein
VEPGNYDNPPDASGSCDDGNRDEYRAQYLNELIGFSDNPTEPLSERNDWLGR